MITIEPPKKEDTRGIQDVFYQTWLTTYPNAELGITKEDIEESSKMLLLTKILRILSSDSLHRKIFLYANKIRVYLTGYEPVIC